MTNKPVLILLHGAWHSSECWQKITPELEAKGYKCIVPQLMFAGHEPPVRSIQPDVNQVQALIQIELSAGNDVVVLSHSFGGTVGCSSVEGFTRNNATKVGNATGRVIGLIAISALLIPTGKSPNEAAGGDFPPFMRPNYETGWVELCVDPIPLFYNDLPPDEAGEYVKKLKNQSLYPSIADEGIYAGFLDVPTWFLQCSSDGSIPLFLQEAIVGQAKDAGANITTRTISTGHSPFLADPKGTVAFITEAADFFQSHRAE